MRIRRRRRPPEPALIRLQLADALMERHGPVGPGSAVEDAARAAALLEDVVGDPATPFQRLPEVAATVLARYDVVPARGRRHRLVEATVSALQGGLLSSAALRGADGSDLAELDGFDAALRRRLTDLAVVQVLDSGADADLERAVRFGRDDAAPTGSRQNGPAAGPTPDRSGDPTGRQARERLAMLFLLRSDQRRSAEDATAAVDLLTADLPTGLLTALDAGAPGGPKAPETPETTEAPEAPLTAEDAHTALTLAQALTQRHRLRHGDGGDDLARARTIVTATLRLAELSGLLTDGLRESAALVLATVPDEAGTRTATTLLDGLGTPTARLARAMIDAHRDRTTPDEATRWDVRSALADRRSLPGLPPLLDAMLEAELGRLAVRDEDWPAALAIFEAAREKFLGLYEAQALPGSREFLLGLRSGFPVLHAYALARTGRAEEAVEILEEGRAVLLGEALHLGRADLTGIPAEAADRYGRAATRVRALLSRPADAPDETSAADLRTARVELAAAVELVRGHPDGAGFLRPAPGEAQRAARAAGGPLVHLAATPDGGYALITTGPTATSGTQPGVRFVELPQLTTEALQRHAVAFLTAHHDRRNDTPAWRRALRTTLDWLGSALAAPLLAALGPVDRCLLVPLGPLGLLPLHAARLPGGGQALDHTVFQYAPGAAAFNAAHRLAAATGPGGRLLAVDDPEPATVPAELVGAETAEVAAHFPANVLRLPGPAATREAVLAALADHDVVHLCCHGFVTFDAPRHSGVRLGDGPLTVASLLDTPLRARLVVLSACESAVFGLDAPDEVIGLPAGFLQAGAAGVIATLWAVDARATALLVARFYRAWRAEGLPPANALRLAQRWLRDSTNGKLTAAFPALHRAPAHLADAADLARWGEGRPYRAPEYWSAFVHVGA
ncbi:CHAT domain-containing protein [Streptomyces goshikiensis]|uniref:CHAT domain-containing protein n=1 Tax=Streptomyces goshikiensis TaxID=1942 RepID=UPI003664A98C